ncbi:hypothetical protein PROFUN_14873 [Planoprotostelium fungivorum]|uniref:Uncharacterized protein n=1 Tax=Planoprotostelium fungivorum TaxID=1890364 RepID=A0A2P6MSB1_9EUKA|nr:hypothetical protein PROFUN_14873 [Planoprotostelium fungivorum]
MYDGEETLISVTLNELYRTFNREAIVEIGQLALNCIPSEICKVGEEETILFSYKTYDKNGVLYLGYDSDIGVGSVKVTYSHKIVNTKKIKEGKAPGEPAPPALVKAFVNKPKLLLPFNRSVTAISSSIWESSLCNHFDHVKTNEPIADLMEKEQRTQQSGGWHFFFEEINQRYSFHRAVCRLSPDLSRISKIWKDNHPKCIAYISLIVALGFLQKAPSAFLYMMNDGDSTEEVLESQSDLPYPLIRKPL